MTPGAREARSSGRPVAQRHFCTGPSTNSERFMTIRLTAKIPFSTPASLARGRTQALPNLPVSWSAAGRDEGYLKVAAEMQHRAAPEQLGRSASGPTGHRTTILWLRFCADLTPEVLTSAGTINGICRRICRLLCVVTRSQHVFHGPRNNAVSCVMQCRTYIDNGLVL